jgi:threonine synthase
VKYVSTRGKAPILDFEGVTLAGLANDGGLYLPEQWPTFSAEEIRAMRGMTYPQLAVAVLSPFVGSSLSHEELSRLSNQAYQNFSHPAIAPIKQLDEQLYFMELFQGPTLAFKDFALQFLGQLFGHFLDKREEKCTIVGATSGDTGSAAIVAVRGLERVNLFMLHPNGRVSDVQRKQMTSVNEKNIHNIAIEGHFDDCQNLVKAMFNDSLFRNQMNLSAVNSINWARIAAQIVYYFRAALALGAPDRPVSFAVPTGNFGNILAGYAAKQMGLPIDQLIIGSNKNDILTRFFETGVMDQSTTQASLSPSMDIQISSNFERFLFEASGRDADKITDLMQQFSTNRSFTADPALYAACCDTFSAFRLDDEETKAEIKRLYDQTGEVIDPHSVIGIAAAKAKQENPDVPVVCMGTAHPAKFADVVESVLGKPVDFPSRLDSAMNAPEQFTMMDNDLKQVQAFVRAHR